MKPSNDLVLDAVDASVASQTSAAIPAAFMIYMSAQVVAVGTLTGTLKIQASNDQPQNGSPSNWSDISQSVNVTAAGVFIIPKFDVSYQYVRAVYTKTTSVGSPTVSVRIKSIGA